MAGVDRLRSIRHALGAGPAALAAMVQVRLNDSRKCQHEPQRRRQDRHAGKNRDHERAQYVTPPNVYGV